MRPRFGRRLRALARTTLPRAALCALVAVPLGPALARADSSQDLADRAAVADSHAEHLQNRLASALKRYDASLQGLAGAVNDSVAAERRALEVQTVAQQAAAGEVQRVRAIYMAGGSIGLVGSMLNAQTPRDLASRMANVSAVVDLASVVSSSARARASSARATAVASRSDARSQIVSVEHVRDAYAALQTLLDNQYRKVSRLTDAAERAAAQEQLAAAQAQAQAATSSAASAVTAGGIPVDFLALYRSAAGTCSGLPWTVLAAVGQIESGHGTSNGPSPSGAEGPMQFLPSTFAGYAVDGNGDGVADIWNPSDAIYSAARYLCANGGGHGPAGLYAALWHYNHADWYVQMVMGVAGQLAVRFGEPVPVATNTG
ncbi:MAG: lytic murein transglycosylase [Actinomycetes bacterium]